MYLAFQCVQFDGGPEIVKKVFCVLATAGVCQEEVCRGVDVYV